MTQIQVDLDALNSLIARLRTIYAIYQNSQIILQDGCNQFDNSYQALNKAEVEASIQQFFRMLLQLAQQNDDLIARLTERLRWLQEAQNVVFIKGDVKGLPTGSNIQINP
jgi:predicted transcriptional regulator